MMIFQTLQALVLYDQRMLNRKEWDLNRSDFGMGCADLVGRSISVP